MTNEPKRPYHHGDLRQAVIDTAMEMLNEDGGAQFTLRELARRAGVSHAAPYKHFEDKSALLIEIALIGFDRLAAALAQSQSASSNSLRGFRIASRAYLDFGMQNPNLYRLMFGPELARMADVHFDRRALRGLEIVGEMLERGQAAGAFRKRPVRGQAAACWAQLHGLTMLSLDGLLVPDKVGENAADAAIDTLLEGLAK